MNWVELQSKAGAVEALLKSFGNRNRLIVLRELQKGERSVGALQQALGLSQPALSQHLARLRMDGVVATRRQSQTIYYSLASEKVARLIGLRDKLYCAPEDGDPETGKRAKRRTA
jgi:DNA-binding transcriptional ArsR family regulator